MKRFISAVATFIAVMLMTALIVPIAACAPEARNNIRVVSMSGFGLSDVSVSVSSGNSVVASGTTDADGNYAVDLENGKYDVKLGNLPKGYNPSDNYQIEITDSQKEVTLGVSSSIITGEDLPNKFFLTGDIMYDFTIDKAYKAVYKQTGDENDDPVLVIESGSLSLADAFEGKKAVLLNIWYANCGPCKAELPNIMEAYSEYKDDIEVIGLNDFPTESNADVESYVMDNKVTYPMGKDSGGICARFNKTSYPVSIMIDRYGVICEFHVGSVADTEFWRSWFAKYTAENYAPNVNPGEDVNSGATEIDKPADFGVEFTKNPEEIGNLINSTGVNVTFTADSSEYSWPWKISGDSIIPTNSGHYGTFAIIYATLEMAENSVLAFDYKLNCKAEKDYFYVVVDGSGGIGTQTLKDSGEKDWRTGHAYISLEAGIHEIAFTYYHMSSLDDDNARVSIKNLRFMSVDQMLSTGVSTDIPYYTARSYDPSTGAYEYYSDVYYDDTDGFYHVSGYRGADGKDPILMADLHHATPYFKHPDASIFSNYVSTSKCTFGGKDYLKQLDSYCTWASCSEITGLIPVTAELKTILEALYKDENMVGDPQYKENGWLEFCAFYRHYGAGDSIGSPIEGLAYFSAIPAHETTNEPDSGNLNVADFQRLIMPKGLLFKFVPEHSGVYKFSGASTEATEAGLYKGNMSLAVKYYNEINYCGSDYYLRNQPEEFDFDKVNFEMYSYLTAGETYYLQVAYVNVDTLGPLKFRIDYMNKSEHKYLTTATAGYYVQGANNVYRIPTYADVEYRESEGCYYTKRSNMPLYCDFTDSSRMFKYPIGTLIGKQGDKKVTNYFDFTDYTMQYNGRTIGGKDYTSIMQQYYDKAVEGKKTTDELYGLTEVTEELREIIMLCYSKKVGFDDPNEWLKACWYYDYTNESKISPDTVLWTANN